MTVTNLIGTLTKGTISTAVHVVRHPIGTASNAVGFARGVAEFGVDLVNGVRTEDHPVETVAAAAPTAAAKVAHTVEKVAETVEKAADTVESAAEAVAEEAVAIDPEPESTPEDEAEPAEKVTETPSEPEHVRDELPGPDLAVAQVPEPADLPQPIVIVAEDTPVPTPPPVHVETEDPVVWTSESSTAPQGK